MIKGDCEGLRLRNSVFEIFFIAVGQGFCVFSSERALTRSYHFCVGRAASARRILCQGGFSRPCRRIANLKGVFVLPTKPRSELFRPDEQAIVHVMNRCVRKIFLLRDKGNGGKGYLPRRQLFENELKKATSGFGIDLMSYAIMDNHFHLILRSRPDVVGQWDDEKVVRQWHKLCPIFHDKNGFPTENPGQAELSKVLSDVDRVGDWRTRLSDISWFMKLVSERIARRINAEDGKGGHFWEGRYKAILLLDERAILTCSMYVDLNRIKAELARSLESSDYTSIQRRLQSFAIRSSMKRILAEQVSSDHSGTTVTSVLIDESFTQENIPDAANAGAEGQAIVTDILPDAHLSPVHIDERNDPIGPHLSTNASRCSDKGFLPITQENYIELLRWTADQLRHTQDGRPFDDRPQCLVELELEPETWCKLVTQFADLFFVVAGMPESIDNHRSCKTGKRFNMPQQTRELLSA